MPPPCLRFGRFALFAGEHRLLRDGTEVPLGPRAFEVLALLAARPGQLVSKDELLAAVWHGLVVEESNLHVQVSQLRKVIGAEAIVTVPSLGYRFVLPVDDGRADAGPAAPAAPATRRLSVIVLPFVESGAPPEQAYFADAITDDITTQLSKIKGSTVIGSPTAFAYRREQFDVPTLARELGVRYVLQGRIERGADGVDTNVRLSDAATGAVVWSDLITVAREGVANIRREVVARLSMALDLQLIAAEAARSARDDAHPEAIDLVMRAQTAGGASWSRAAYEASLALYDRALEIQPDLGVALSGRALVLTSLAWGWPEPDIETLIERAERDVLRALDEDSADPQALRTLSRVRQLQFRLGTAITVADQALELSPNHSLMLHWRAVLAVLNGEPGQAFDQLHRALALSPRDPYRWSWQFWLGTAHLHLGQYEQAVVCYERTATMLPFWGCLRFLAAAYGQLGQVEQARSTWQQMLRDPACRHVRWVRLSNHPELLRQHREHLGGGLVKAGIPGAMEELEEWISRQRPGVI